MLRRLFCFNQDASGGSDAAPAVAAVVVEAAAVEAPVVAEAAAVEATAVVEVPEVVIPPVVEPAKTEEPVEGWNGEVEHIAKQAWFDKLDEQTRTDVLAGIKTKYSNLEGGYGKKFTALADERRGWESERGTLAAQIEQLNGEIALFKDVFGADDKETLAKFEADKAELIRQHGETLAPITTELESLRAFKAEIDAARATEYQAAVAKLAEEIQASCPDILAIPAASDTFDKLLMAGFDVTEAADVTRRKHDIKAAKLPAAAEHASRGDGPNSRDEMPQGLPIDQAIEIAVARAAKKLGHG